MNQEMRSQEQFQFACDPPKFVRFQITLKKVELEIPIASQIRDIFKGFPTVVHFWMF